MSPKLHKLALAAVLTGLAGCATVDSDFPREASNAFVDTGNTYLGREAAEEVKGKPADYSGFFPLYDGIDALSTRLVMAAEAERSIDVQYYLLKPGITGTAFLQALLQAADRGVRVRLLLDDMFTNGYDTGMAALDAHPNFEIRIFNPFASRSARFWDGLTDFSRINRRMHNKSFTVDNQMTVVGGRNIADEYFGAREDAKFSDLDVIGVGPIVQDVSDMFDAYWNHELAAPVEAFAKMPDNPEFELERARARLAEAATEIETSVYAAAVKDRVLEWLETEANELFWAPYTLAFDSPDKGIKSKAKAAGSITEPLIESLLSAERELIIVSPYFVPRNSGVQALSEIRARGIDVTIITNSLAANNQSTVHGGYAPSRKPLLKNGIRLFEVRADAGVSGSEFVAASGAKATLHTKAFLVDRRETFVGSFNFDPRSANINTELGVIIRSPELSEWLGAAVDEALKANTFEVFLNEDGRLRWRGWENGEEVIYDKEPQTTWSQRFSAGFMRLLPIRGQL